MSRDALNELFALSVGAKSALINPAFIIDFFKFNPAFFKSALFLSAKFIKASKFGSLNR